VSIVSGLQNFCTVRRQKPKEKSFSKVKEGGSKKDRPPAFLGLRQEPGKLPLDALLGL